MTMDDLTQIQEQLNRIERATIIASKKALTIDEVINFTGLAKRTIYELTSRKQIPYSKTCGRLFFDKDEIENWLLQHHHLSTDDIKSQAATYVATRF